jgi:hypothetical protein
LGKIRNSCKLWIRKPEEKRPLVRHRHRWEDIRMDLREKWWEGVDWIHLAQDTDQWQAPVKTVVTYLCFVPLVGRNAVTPACVPDSCLPTCRKSVCGFSLPKTKVQNQDGLNS